MREQGVGDLGEVRVPVVGLRQRDHHELRRAHVDVLGDHLLQPVEPGRDHRARVDPGPTVGHRGGDHLGDRTVGVGDQGAEVLRLDLAARLGGVRLDGDDAVPHVLGRAERGQPAVAQAAAAPQLGRCDAAQPDVERLLEREGPHDRALVAEALALVIDGLAGPEAAEERQHLVEELRPGATLHAERLVLAGVGRAETEGREQPAAAQAVEGRQLLRQQHRVAPGHHEHGEPELDLGREAGGDAEARRSDPGSRR